MFGLGKSKKLSADERISNTQTKMIVHYPFFASMVLSLTVEQCDDLPMPTMATDGTRLLYDESFVNKLATGELNFVLAHEVMHCAFGHIWRRGTRDPKIWNIACDYAVNGQLKAIVGAYQESRQRKQDRIPLAKFDFPEGALYDEKFADLSAESIYKKLVDNQSQLNFKSANGDGDNDSEGNGEGEGEGGKGGDDQDGQGSGKRKPSKGKGKGKEASKDGRREIQEPGNHGAWAKEQNKGIEHCERRANEWDGRFINAAEQAMAQGIAPAGLKLALSKLKKPQRDWRAALQEYIQEFVNDYSFMPPDRRTTGEFLMPDFNDTVDCVEGIFFAVDCSGSMPENAITACFSEIQGAVDQFSNRLYGNLGFFDGDLYDPIYNFDDVDDISKIIPVGGGGTSFTCVFRYIDAHPDKFENLNAIIIMTDGYCDYPPESITRNVPVIWVYTTPNNEPPFGRSLTIDPDSI